MVSTATIQGVISGGYTITAWCPNNHNARLDLAALAARLGPQHSAARAALLPKLRCATCGEKANAIVCAPPSGPRGWPGG